MNIIHRDVWASRYVECLVAAGLDREAAESAAQVAVEHADDWLSPEDAAFEEIGYWYDPS